MPRHAHPFPSAIRRRIIQSLVGTLCALSLVACGGGDDGAFTPPEAPAPAPNASPRPTAEGLTGVWSGGGHILLISAEGLAYGLLSLGDDVEIVRGTVLGLDHQVQASDFKAVSLIHEAPPRQLAFAGQFLPRSRIQLNPVPDDGSRVTVDHDEGHVEHVPLSEQAGSYDTEVHSVGGNSDRYTLTLSEQGSLSLTSQSVPQCQANGQLNLRDSSPGLMDLNLGFEGEGCVLPAGTVINGLAIFDPAIRMLTAFAMSDDSAVGVFLIAEP